MSPGNFGFDPMDEAVRRDPYPLYARARLEFPVYEHAGLPLLSVFRYRDVEAVLKDDGRIWSSNFAPFIQPYLIEQPELAAEMPPFMATLDGEAHQRQRALINKVGLPRMLRDLEPRLDNIVNELFDDALAKREVDLPTALTGLLPIRAIARLFGVPEEDSEMLQQWSRQIIDGQFQGFLKPPNAEFVARQIAATREIHAYFGELADMRRARPSGDLISGLVAAEEGGTRLSRPEILQILTVLLIAGTATTTALIGNLVVELVNHRDQLARLRADPGLIPTAVDEVLRFAAPMQATARVGLRASELSGRPIEPGRFVLLWLGSANRDESVFKRADEFDVGRAYNPHVSFGAGPHSCVGSRLALLEGCVVLRALLKRTSSFELTNVTPLPLHTSFVAHSYRQLPMRLVAV